MPQSEVITGLLIFFSLVMSHEIDVNNGKYLKYDLMGQLHGEIVIRFHKTHTELFGTLGCCSEIQVISHDKEHGEIHGILSTTWSKKMVDTFTGHPIYEMKANGDTMSERYFLYWLKMTQAWMVNNILFFLCPNKKVSCLILSIFPPSFTY